ncbi:hypothetical protein BJX68DRAFT_268247 [Aspergillus pseudodeflectus]|uniref:Uncharacterized protein n=1 Tax=Aspergillus pseudodeflectus TaxID=176178 RepID=A0ABR4K4Y1_9EURO
MSNRDYYGDNVPVGLAQNTTSTHPAMNSTTQPGSDQKVEQYKQPQTQWGDECRSDAYEPNSKLNTLPEGEGEGERGLGSTVVGGAGVRVDLSSPPLHLDYLPRAVLHRDPASHLQGAFIGHKVGKKSDHGTLGAIGGAVAVKHTGTGTVDMGWWGLCAIVELTG